MAELHPKQDPSNGILAALMLLLALVPSATTGPLTPQQSWKPKAGIPDSADLNPNIRD